MRTVCFVVSLFRRSLSSCHSLYGIELASEGTSVFFSLMGVFSSSSIPSTKTPAHNALQRTRGSSFPCNKPKEKKDESKLVIWESFKKCWSSRNTQNFGTLDKCWKRFTTKGDCRPGAAAFPFLQAMFVEKSRPMVQKFKKIPKS